VSGLLTWLFTAQLGVQQMSCDWLECELIELE